MLVSASHVAPVVAYTHRIVRSNSTKYHTAISDHINATFAWKHSNAAKIWNSIRISILAKSPTNAHFVQKHVSIVGWVRLEFWFSVTFMIFISRPNCCCLVASSGNCFSHRKRVHSDKNPSDPVPTITTTSNTSSRKNASADSTSASSKKLVKA